jgi:hypothetical protein
MADPAPVRFKRSDFIAARSFFRSLFMEGWRERYPTWQDAILSGLPEWSFTAESLTATVAELSQIATYPESEVASWVAKVCSGLPAGSPEPDLTSRDFVRHIRSLLTGYIHGLESSGQSRQAL